MKNVHTFSVLLLTLASALLAFPDFGLVGYASINGGVSGGKGGTSRTISTIEELVNGKIRRKTVNLK